MLSVSKQETIEHLPFDLLINAICELFKKGVEAPLRHHHHLKLGDTKDATLLLMPAWDSKGLGGVKLVNVNPGNSDIGKPSINSTYLLFNSRSGEHLAIMDGAIITARRTAAASALAASYLARENASTLLIIGAGKVASNIAQAMKVVRPIDKIYIWNRRYEGAENLASDLREQGFDCEAVDDLEAAVRNADIISCSTLSTSPILKGKWLQPGQHIDLIGSFTPKMREADDEAILRSCVFVDVDGAFKESGDIIDPIASGIILKSDICANLSSLCKGQSTARNSLNEITLFKSVGTALEDIAAAGLVYKQIVECTK